LPKKLEFRTDTIQAQISRDSHKYIKSRRRDIDEPIYSVLDRLLNEYKNNEVAKLSETLDKWKVIANAYLQRAIEAENRLKEREQMRLI
jgi:hypothetical protein